MISFHILFHNSSFFISYWHVSNWNHKKNYERVSFPPSFSTVTNSPHYSLFCFLAKELFFSKWYTGDRAHNSTHSINAILSFPRFHTSLHSHFISFSTLQHWTSFQESTRHQTSRSCVSSSDCRTRKQGEKDYIIQILEKRRENIFPYIIHIFQEMISFFFEAIYRYLFLLRLSHTHHSDRNELSLRNEIFFSELFASLCLVVWTTDERKYTAFAGERKKFLYVWHRKKIHIATTQKCVNGGGKKLRMKKGLSEVPFTTDWGPTRQFMS